MNILCHFFFRITSTREIITTAISVMVKARQSLEMAIAMKECMKMEKEMDLEFIGTVILCNLQ